MKHRYGIAVAALGGASSSHNTSRQNYLADSSYLNDNDDGVVVGNEHELKKLVQCINDYSMDRAVISIWGMGGSGKTTLVSSIYRQQKVRKNFDCYAWITVSPNYHVEDLLSKLIKQLHNSEDHGTNDRTYLVETIPNYLRTKTYLVVLDDMWNRDFWLCFDQALVKNNCGSRVIITTRIETVASLAQQNHTVRIGLL